MFVCLIVCLFDCVFACLFVCLLARWAALVGLLLLLVCCVGWNVVLVGLFLFGWLAALAGLLLLLLVCCFGWPAEFVLKAA